MSALKAANAMSSGATKRSGSSRAVHFGLSRGCRCGGLAGVACLIAMSVGCTPSDVDHAGPSEPSHYFIRISANPESIPAVGDSAALIDVYVVTVDDKPASGVPVFFTTTLGKLQAYEFSAAEDQWQKSDVPRTSTEGRVYAFLQSSQVVGAATVAATVEDSEAVVYVHFL